MSREQDSPSTQNDIQAEKHLRQELMLDALQYPTTIVPLFGVALAFIFIVIELPWLPIIGLVIAIALIVAAAAVSFIWRFFMRYEEETPDERNCGRGHGQHEPCSLVYRSGN